VEAVLCIKDKSYTVFSVIKQRSDFDWSLVWEDIVRKADKNGGCE